MRTEDLDKPFVKDIKAVVESDEFLAVITDPKTIFASFQRPDWIKARLAAKAVPEAAKSSKPAKAKK